MYKQIINDKKSNLDESIDRFKVEIGKIRTGRANVALVEDLSVDYYGSKTPLKQVASINVPEPRMIMIQPWDKNSLAAIESAIRSSDLGLNPTNDGQVVRVVLPALTEERRGELVKFLNKKAEESKVSIRSIREEIWKMIQDLEKEGKIGEDDKFMGKEQLQKIVDEYNQSLEDIRERKEKEIMTV